MIGQQPDLGLIQDLAERLNTPDLLQWIEARTTELARIGWKRPGYVNLGPRLLAEMGIAGCIRDAKLPTLAALSPRGDGSYTIRHHGFSSEQDHRFWIAHEAAHTFWLLPAAAGRPLSPRQRILGSDPTIEWLCNRAAAALLVPRGLLEVMLRECGYHLSDDPPPIHLIEPFARKLRVTPRLLARRWFHDILRVQRNTVCLTAAPWQSKSVLQEQLFRIVWEAVFCAATKLPRQLLGRVVPQAALPITPPAKTEVCRIDARWLSLVLQARGIMHRVIPFSRLPYQGDISGLIARGRTGVLLSFLG